MLRLLFFVPILIDSPQSIFLLPAFRLRLLSLSMKLGTSFEFGKHLLLILSDFSILWKVG